MKAQAFSRQIPKFIHDRLDDGTVDEARQIDLADLVVLMQMMIVAIIIATCANIARQGTLAGHMR